MLARRLMIAMLVMLGLASLSAALVPVPEESDERSTAGAQATERRHAGEEAAAGHLIRARVSADVERPRTIRVGAGDQLALRVDADEAVQVEIPEFGRLADVQPGGPARFDLYATRPGSFPVRVVKPPRTIARIEVREEGQGAKSESDGG